MNTATCHLSAVVLAATLLPTAAARADFRSGQSGDLALGQMENRRRTVSPAAIAVDPNTRKVFVSDVTAHRVLRFGTMADLQTGSAAEAVFGQPDFESLSARTPAEGMYGPSGVAVDRSFRLWVADTYHHRVLRFDNASYLASGSAPSAVLGQPNFGVANTGTAENQMTTPVDVAAGADGSLWVADGGNNRVLRFNNAAAKPIGGNADAVLGQPGFGSAASATAAAGMNGPSGLFLETSANDTGLYPSRLWVADSVNNRVLRFDFPLYKPNGAAADGVLGQTTLQTGGPSTTRGGLSQPQKLTGAVGTLWVGDSSNNRVLRFSEASGLANGGDADLVFGQVTFNTNASGWGPGNLRIPKGLATEQGRLWICDGGNERVVWHDQAAQKGNGTSVDGALGQMNLSNPPVSPSQFGDPQWIAVDPASGKLFVSDTPNHRVLRFPSARALVTGAAAEAAFGQPDLFSSNTDATATRLRGPGGISVDHNGHLWVVDSGNHRVLRFDNAASAPSGAAAVQVLGQAGFTQSAASSVTAASMSFPGGIFAESVFSAATLQWQTERLWVADTSHNRILRFDHPLTLPNGASANAVLGQPGFAASAQGFAANQLSTPLGISVDPSGVLWVADSYNGRVLRYNAAAQKASGAPADGVLGQPGFAAASTQVSGSVCSTPAGVEVSPAGRLYVVDNTAHRIVWFDSAAGLLNGSPANGVLGQPDFTSGGGSAAWTRFAAPAACALDPNTGRLWVADRGNYRVLRFTPALDSSIDRGGFTLQGKFGLLINARGGELFAIHSSADLLDWSTAEGTLRAAGTSFQSLVWTAPAAPAGPHRFYRLEIP